MRAYDYNAFNFLQDGFNRIKNENNGFIELFKRDDLFKIITDRYKLMSLNCKDEIYPPSKDITVRLGTAFNPYYEELLDKKYFFRVHKSYLINI